jgi:hypothetical protein
MRLLAAVAVLLGPLALATAVPQLEHRVSYDGYRVYRIATHHNAASVKAQLKGFATVPFNLDTDEHLDVAIPPGQISAFESLGLETEVMHEDLGADIAEEGSFAAYRGTETKAASQSQEVIARSRVVLTAV